MMLQRWRIYKIWFVILKYIGLICKKWQIYKNLSILFLFNSFSQFPCLGAGWLALMGLSLGWRLLGPRQLVIFRQAARRWKINQRDIHLLDIYNHDNMINLNSLMNESESNELNEHDTFTGISIDIETKVLKSCHFAKTSSTHDYLNLLMKCC